MKPHEVDEGADEAARGGVAAASALLDEHGAPGPAGPVGAGDDVGVGPGDREAVEREEDGVGMV